LLLLFVCFASAGCFRKRRARWPHRSRGVHQRHPMLISPQVKALFGRNSGYCETSKWLNS
jgi:hypothetical protein